MQGRRVFVSGGAGVIGLEMIPLLVERGAQVLVGDLKPRPSGFPDGVVYRQGDLNLMPQEELAAFAPEIFIHLAATFERSEESYGFWEENFWHNVRLSHHLMTLAKDLPSLKRVVFASSYLIYDPVRYQFAEPQAAPLPLTEADPILPRNLTGMAKLSHEIELRFLRQFRAAAFTTTCARIFRGYGRNSRDIISRWVRMLLAGERISVYRPEGLFDYVYARDSAEGLIRLAAADSVPEIVNLGTGRSRRVRDVLDVLATHFPDLTADEVEADIPYEASEADITLLRATLDWSPRFDLPEAIAEIVAHERAAAQRNSEPAAPAGAILITSAARKVPLVRAAIDAARRLNPALRLIAGDRDEAAATRHVADDFWAMPATGDADIEAILAGCRERGVRVILPTRDGELAFWARHRERFAQAGIDVIVSGPEAIDHCLDKLAFAAFGEARGLPFIPARLDLDALPGDRFVAKERYGAGSRAIGLDLDRAAARRHGEGLKDPIYQPYIEGEEISIDAWLDRSGAVKGVVLRRRDKVVDGESQVTTTFRDPAIEAKAAEILASLRLRGPVVMQALLGSDGALHVIECNSRFGGASTTAIAAGLDMLYWSLLEGFGATADAAPFHRRPGEIRQIRVPQDIHVPYSGL
jgi:carbamoyl-phosphate synthase large subunit